MGFQSAFFSSLAGICGLVSLATGYIATYIRGTRLNKAVWIWGRFSDRTVERIYGVALVLWLGMGGPTIVGLFVMWWVALGASAIGLIDPVSAELGTTLPILLLGFWLRLNYRAIRAFLRREIWGAPQPRNKPE